MIFTNPLILYALPLSLLPLVIHLINLQRQKTVYFSNLWFLKKTQQQTKNTKKIHNLLLLTARILLIASLIIAFSQPIITGNNKNKLIKSNVNLIIDNSFSMQATINSKTLIKTAKQKAIELINKLPVNNTINLSFLSSEKTIKHISKNTAINRINNIKLLPPLHDINSSINNVVKQNNKLNQFIIISDFQKNILHQDTIFKDSNQVYKLINLKPDNSQNISIDTMWFENAILSYQQSNILHIKINNHSKKPVNQLPIKILINNTLYSAGTISIDGLKQKTYDATILINRKKILNIEAKIEHMPITFDNSYFQSYLINNQTTICEISESPSKYLKTLYNDTSQFKLVFQKIENIKPSVIKDANTIILHDLNNINPTILNIINQEVINNNHKNLIIIPNIKLTALQNSNIFKGLNINSWKELKYDSCNINKINLNSTIYKNSMSPLDNKMYYPQIDTFMLINNKNKYETLLSNDLDDPMLIKIQNKYLNIYQFTFNALDKRFSTNPIFIPTFYNIALINNQNNMPSIICGKKNNFTLSGNMIPNNDETIHIKANQLDFIPYTYQKNKNLIVVVEKNQIYKPGFYKIENNKNKNTWLSANFNKSESNTKYYSKQELTKIFKNNNRTLIFNNKTKTDKIIANNIPLWKYFMALSIVLIILETWLIKKREKKVI